MESGSDICEGMFLKVNEELHPFPFVGSVEEFTVSLQNSSGTIARGRNVPFFIRLVDSEGNEHPLEVLGSAPSRGICPLTGRSPSVKVRFLNCTPQDRQLFLQVLPSHAGDALLGLAGGWLDPIEAFLESLSSDLSQVLDVSPAEVPLQQVVRHRFEIVNKYHSQDVPAVYFKDEGGQKNTIKLMVQLVDLMGRKVKSRPGVKVKPLLCYESGEKVADQSILKICEGSSLYLGELGQAVICCQIRDISQHHRHQKFMVLITADSLEDMDGDMSSVASPGILVRSKISTKNRLKRLAEQDEEDIKSLIKTKESRALLGRSSTKKIKSEDARCISPNNSPCPPTLLNLTMSMIEFIDSSMAKLQELAAREETSIAISDMINCHKVYRRILVENNLSSLPVVMSSLGLFSTPPAVAEEFDARAKNVASSLGE